MWDSLNKLRREKKMLIEEKIYEGIIIANIIMYGSETYV